MNIYKFTGVSENSISEGDEVVVYVREDGKCKVKKCDNLDRSIGNVSASQISIHNIEVKKSSWIYPPI